MYERNYKLLSSKFRELFFPTLFTSMTGNISIFLDSLIVSNLLGATVLASIQPINPLITFVNLIYWMIGLGGSVLCAVSKAEFDYEKSNSIFSVSIKTLLIIGVLITLICLLFSSQIIAILCPSDNKALFGQFFLAYIIGIPFLCYMMSMSYFVRADGFSNLPFKASLLCNIVNLCLDFIFILVFDFGLAGAGLATAIGYMVGSLYVSTYFFSKERTLKFIRLKVKPYLNHVKNICKSGFSSASSQLYITIKLFVVNMLVVAFAGVTGLGAFNICFNSLIIISMFIIGAAQTMSPMVSVYFKEADYSGVNFVVKRAFKIVLASSIILTLLFVIYPDILLMLYRVKNPADVPIVVNAIRLFSLSYVGLSISSLYMYYTQAIEENKISSTVSILEGLIFPVALAILLSAIMGINGVWISFAVAEVFTVIFIYAYSKYKNKKTNGDYSGFFMNKNNKDNENILEYAINGEIEEAVELSKNIGEHLSDVKSGTIVNLAIEEILVNIININDKVDFIDIIVKIDDDSILISIKDPGIEFNPVIENDELQFDNISVLNKIADKIEYARVLGLNSTVIHIN
ncbi:MAG: hypothetical protein E7Z74_01260 [Methanobrevibacter millerae]|uniref:MatE efflux family protein n=1 Tax=Methanobrevibacter millerae TaxID=230361 RepID=A0A8T3VQN5_9EURY|nr:hypothetical protein [Methanobrevibacter millerae]